MPSSVVSDLDSTVKQSLFGLYRARDFRALADRTQTLLDAHPGEPLLHSLRGAACLVLGQLDAAIQSYRQALAIQPGAAKLHNSLGLAYLRARRLGEAMASFGNAIRADAQFAEPRFNLGLILENLQKPGDAANAYQQAVQLEPNYCKAWCALAKVRWQLGQYERVVESYERALAIDATHVAAHRGLMQFLEQGNRHDALRQALDRARKALGTEHPLVRLQEGIVADIDGRGDTARNLLEQCQFDAADPLSSHDERLRLARLTSICMRLDDADATMEYAAGANRLARRASEAKGIEKNKFLSFMQNRQRYYTPENIANWPWNERQPGLPSHSPAVRAPHLERAMRDTRNAGEHPGASPLGGGPLDKGRLPPTTQPLFIIGFPRSGTTLLDAVLRGHPDIRVVEESAAVPAMVNDLCGAEDERLEMLGNLSDTAIERAKTIYFNALEEALLDEGNKAIGAGDALADANTDARAEGGSKPIVIDRFALKHALCGGNPSNIPERQVHPGASAPRRIRC